MATVLIAARFKTDLGMVEHESKVEEILKTIELLEVIPSMGSTNVPESLTREFGEGIHKVVVNPFIIVTKYDEDNEVVKVYGLVHQRAAW